MNLKETYAKKNERIPKYKQREMDIDAVFEKLGISLEDYMTRADKALKDAESMGVYPFNGGFSPNRPYSNVTWFYQVAEDGTFRSYTELDKGDCYAYGEIKFLLDQGEISVDCAFSKVVDVRYNPSRSYVNQSLATPEPLHVEITSNPEADVAKVLSYVKDNLRELPAAAQKAATAAAGRDATKGKYSWSEVRAYIDEESLWDIEEADRADITGYLDLGKEIPFAMYRPSGSLIKCRNSAAWLSNSFRFSKIEIVWIEGMGLSQEEVDEANAELATAKDSAEIGIILCSL